MASITLHLTGIFNNRYYTILPLLHLIKYCSSRSIIQLLCQVKVSLGRSACIRFINVGIAAFWLRCMLLFLSPWHRYLYYSFQITNLNTNIQFSIPILVFTLFIPMGQKFPTIVDEEREDDQRNRDCNSNSNYMNITGQCSISCQVDCQVGHWGPRKSVI